MKTNTISFLSPGHVKERSSRSKSDRDISKIAFLTSEYPHSKTGNSGGIGTSIKNLAIGLLQQGCSVRILVYGQKQESVFEDQGIVIQQIKNIKLKGLSWFLTRKKIQKIINELYDQNEIDVVEASDWTGITSFVQPKKCPLVIKIHGSDTFFCHLDNRPVKWINKFHEKRALRKADALLSVSQFAADLTNEVFGLKMKFTIIPNSVDIDLFDSEKSNKTDTLKAACSPFGAGGAGLLYFGSLIRKKGLLELPYIFNEVFKKNPNAKLILIGKDVPDIVSGNASTWAMMKKLFTNEALQNVTYLGSVPYEEIQKQINTATICVFPSFAEALPVSWIEAMALQKPVVASNIGWATEIIADGQDGFLVHPKDHVTYAQKIVELLENPDLREAFGSKARNKIVQNFSIEIVSKKSFNFYQSTIKSQ